MTGLADPLTISDEQNVDYVIEYLSTLSERGNALAAHNVKILRELKTVVARVSQMSLQREEGSNRSAYASSALDIIVDPFLDFISPPYREASKEQKAPGFSMYDLPEWWDLE